MDWFSTEREKLARYTRTGKLLQVERTACMADGGVELKRRWGISTTARGSVWLEIRAHRLYVCLCVCTCLGVEILPRDGRRSKDKFTDIIYPFFRTKDFELLQEGNRKWLHFQQERERLVFLKRSLAVAQFFLRLDYIQWLPLRSSPVKESTCGDIHWYHSE